MRSSILSFSILSVVSLALARPTDTYKVFEKLPAIPTGWKVDESKHVDLTSNIKLRIHLTQQNVAKFEKAVIDMSTPGHVEYGNHMSQLQINAMLQPDEKTVEGVKQWLASSGVEGAFNNDWVTIITSIGNAENLLRTKYQYFYNDETKDEVLRTLGYSIPVELHDHINMIQPTTMFGRMSAMKSTIESVEAATQTGYVDPTSGYNGRGLNATACNVTITPDCLSALYGYKNFRASKREGQLLGVNGFLEQYAQNDDLELFLEKYKPKAANQTFVCQPVAGGLCTQDPVNEDYTEANLDIQYTVSASYPIPNKYFSTAGRPPVVNLNPNTNEPYLDWLEYVLALDASELPQTITTSYGDDEQTVPLSYARSACNLFAQLGARGVSVMFSSGDSGPGGSCVSNDGQNRTMFIPTFPASCPFVTSVGGTRYVVPEQAVSFSSGGFSNYFPRPDYQEAAVGSYLATQADAKTFAAYYNSTGRGFPDVAAQGVRFHVIIAGKDGLVSGTSASSPAFAGVVALLNGHRMSKGLKPLGFLNPWLYSVAGPRKGFVDITLGTSRGCTGRVPNAGWKATTGWDPVTGLGTPDFKILADLVLE